MRSLLKRRNKGPTQNNHNTKKVGGGSDCSSPPMITPIDPDGSTASHDSNEIYISEPGAPHDRHDHDAPADMTASQFKSSSDEEMQQKRAQQPVYSPHYAPPNDSSNSKSLNPFRTKQGKNCTTKSRDGVPIITSAGADHFSPSAVSSKVNYATDGFYSKSKKVFSGKDRPKVRPSAKHSAFGGAPRYDWMDIETTAAIKIQALYRRIALQNDLDKLGISTPGMRNRRAQRQARYQQRMSRGVNTSADVPFPFNLCGVGLLFGDSTFEDENIVDSMEKRRLQKMKEGYEREDAEKRKFRMRKKESQHMEEGIEVVESFDDQEQEEGEGEEESREQGSQQSSISRMKKMGKTMKSMKLGGKSKKLSRDQNDFDPNEDDEEDEGQFL